VTDLLVSIDIDQMDEAVSSCPAGRYRRSLSASWPVSVRTTQAIEFSDSRFAGQLVTAEVFLQPQVGFPVRSDHQRSCAETDLSLFAGGALHAPHGQALPPQS